MSVRETVEREIESVRAHARDAIDATDEEIERGLQIHAETVACDLFGFLPSTRSTAGRELLAEMIEVGSTTNELIPVGEVIDKTSPAYDPTCAAQFSTAIESTGLDCTVLTAGSEKNLHHSINRISACIHLFDAYDGPIRKVTSVAELDDAVAADELAVFFSTNCPPAQGGLRDGMDAHWWIGLLYRLGVRIMHLTYNRRNWVGDGCLEPADGGLSIHGREVVRQLNRLGIAVDTAHSGRQTTLDAAACSEAPIMATHTTCTGVYEFPRGKSDAELQAIADGGGLIGICAIPHFLARKGNLADLLDHVEYAVELVGPEHVAIGTDNGFRPASTDDQPSVPSRPSPSPYGPDEWFGAWDYAPERADIPAANRKSLAWVNWPLFTVGLVARGFDAATIERILGGNFRRVMREVEETKDAEAFALHRVEPRYNGRSP